MIKNSKTSYGWLSILLHWVMAIAFIALFFLGQYMVDLDYYDAWYHRAPEIHKSIGILLLMAMLFRFFWNKFQTSPDPISTDVKTELAARITHYLFYLLVIMLFISGYMISTAEGKGIDVFSWFTVPALFTEDPDRADFAGDIHEIIATGFVILAAIHALAALYHHFIIKDFTLKRMLGITTTNKGDTK
jgi:cytochrome b561